MILQVCCPAVSLRSQSTSPLHLSCKKARFGAIWTVQFEESNLYSLRAARPGSKPHCLCSAAEAMADTFFCRPVGRVHIKFPIRRITLSAMQLTTISGRFPVASKLLVRRFAVGANTFFMWLTLSKFLYPPTLQNSRL